jgi:diguanylate cyclase (GGDEF)-like protein
MPDRDLQLDASAGVFSLTQIRHLMRVEFSRAQRYEYPLACLLVACDRLGALRDLHGYEARAAVLDEVSALLRRTTRSCDYLGCIQDDRWLAILPHTSPDGAQAAAGRLLAAARALEVELGGIKRRITLSIGVACYERENTLFFDSLVDASEAALASAMAAGGDRYLVRDPAPAARAQ